MRHHRPFLLYSSGTHQHLHSFPTRRSSDLSSKEAPDRIADHLADAGNHQHEHHDQDQPEALERHVRSEEHTSELQSQSNLVCRLLLEKKKKSNTPTKVN